MAKILDPNENEMVSHEELLRSLVYTQEALVNLLEKKGMITKKEMLEEIKRLKAEHPHGS